MWLWSSPGWRFTANQRDGSADLVEVLVSSSFDYASANLPRSVSELLEILRIAAAQAFERAFGRQPVFVRSGGGNPVLRAFQQHPGVELIVSGFGLPDDHLHAPNEKLDIAQFEGGIKTRAALLEELAG